MSLLPIIIMLALVPALAQAQLSRLAGPAQAISGSALEMEDPAGETVTVALAGLAAPPPGKLCPSPVEGVADWECGDGSRQALAGLVQGEIVECRLLAEDDGRLTGDCMVQTRNVSEWMLGTGRAILAPGWRGRNAAWDLAETRARRARAMLWASIDR